MHSIDRSSRFPARDRGVILALAITLSAASPAGAQTIVSSSISKSSVDALVDQLGEGFEHRSIVQTLEQSPTRLRFRVAFVAATDWGAGARVNLESVLHERVDVSFGVSSTEQYSYRISASVRGAFTTVNDGPTEIGNDVAEGHIGDIDFSFFGFPAEPFIDLDAGRGPTTNTGNTPVTASGSVIRGLGALAPSNNFTFRLTFTASCRTEVVGAVGNGPECAARFGLPATFGNQTAGLYPGSGNRDQSEDGLFITVELLPPLPTATPTPTPTATSTRTPTPTPTPGGSTGFRIDDVSVIEGNSGTTAAVFTVTLTGSRSRSASVRAITSDSTASAGSDYQTTSTIVDFGPLENQKTFSVPVLGDTTRELNESFLVRLGDASGAPIADGQGVGTILNDDGVSVGIADLQPGDTVTESDEVTALTLRWLHPERWRALDTVDLRLVDDDGVVFWSRFDEAANTFSLCDANGICGDGAAPGTDEVLDGDTAVLYLADSAVVGSGPTGPSVDLRFAFSLDSSTAGRSFRVEAAATDDGGAQQEFEQVGTLEVESSSSGGGDGCSVRAGGDRPSVGWEVLVPLLVLVRCRTRLGRRTSR